MKLKETEKDTVKSARRNFLAMAGAYCLGVFNDNFFKQAVLLVAVSAGLSHLQGPATVLFALPFILFSAYAGWLADRFPKRKVVIASKLLEIVAMLVGAFGLLTGNWNCVLAMVFMMGAQSAFFSPALNGSIPELYPADYVPRANAVLKLLTTLAILAGIALSGVALDLQWLQTQTSPFGHLAVAAVVVTVALAGFAASLGTYSNEPATASIAFPWLGPLNSLRDVKEACKDRQLLLALAADSFFYFIASTAVLTINVFGVQQLGLSQTVTSMLSMSLMAGVCAGALIAAKIMSMQKWSQYLFPSALAMGIGLTAAGLAPQTPQGLEVWILSFALTGTGVAGGLFLIPVTSFLQIRPHADAKGRVLATANFCGFIAILLAGAFFGVLNDFVAPSYIMLLLAIVSFVGSLAIGLTNAHGRPILGPVLRGLLSLRYRVHIKGMENLNLEEGKGVLFLPNHPALIDPVIVMSSLYRYFRPRPLSDRDQVTKPIVRQIMRLVKPITLPSPRKNGRRSGAQVREALQQVVDHLLQGEQILLYPSGRLYRSAKETLMANSAVETIVRNVPDLQVVLVRTSGLWGSSFSRAHSGAPSLFRHLGRYITAILSGFLFWTPKRNVTVELFRDHVVSSLSGRRTINAHLENFYNTRVTGNTHIPYYWWKGRRPQLMPEPAEKIIKGNVSAVPSTIKKQVKLKLGYLTGKRIEGDEHLANDLAMDSLTLMEFAAWLPHEFGVAAVDSSTLITVNDCLLAADGQSKKGGGELASAALP